MSDVRGLGEHVELRVAAAAWLDALRNINVAVRPARALVVCVIVGRFSDASEEEVADALRISECEAAWLMRAARRGTAHKVFAKLSSDVQATAMLVALAATLPLDLVRPPISPEEPGKPGRPLKRR